MTDGHSYFFPMLMWGKKQQWSWKSKQVSAVLTMFRCLFILKLLCLPSDLLLWPHPDTSWVRIWQRATPHVRNLSLYWAVPVWLLKLQFPNHDTKNLCNVHGNKKSLVVRSRRNQPSCSGISQNFSVCLSDSFILLGIIHIHQSLPTDDWNNISKWSGWRYRNRAGQ